MHSTFHSKIPWNLIFGRDVNRSAQVSTAARDGQLGLETRKMVKSELNWKILAISIDLTIFLRPIKSGPNNV